MSDLPDDIINRILPVLATADGGCSVCGHYLLEKFGEEFKIPSGKLATMFKELKESGKIDAYWDYDPNN